MRRRPVLRAVAIGGGAYIVAKRRRMALARPLRADPLDDRAIGVLERLGDLRDRGVITEAEFAGQKARLLGGWW